MHPNPSKQSQVLRHCHAIHLFDRGRAAILLVFVGAPREEENKIVKREKTISGHIRPKHMKRRVLTRLVKAKSSTTYRKEFKHFLPFGTQILIPTSSSQCQLFKQDIIFCGCLNFTRNILCQTSNHIMS